MRSNVALITGTSRGIGRGIALALAKRGWTIVVNYRGNKAAAQQTLADVRTTGGDGIVVQANIADSTERDHLVTTTLNQYGRIDLLVNNAGMAPRQRLGILETTAASYDEVLGVNLKGPFFLTQRIANEMIRLKQNGIVETPIIVNMGSISAYTSSPNRAEYCISKAGMGMMTTLFADTLSPYGINVYEIRPGIIETDMTGAVKAKYDTQIADGLTPIRRWGQADDIGRAVVALVEGLFPFSTGEVFNVDGGFHMHRL